MLIKRCPHCMADLKDYDDGPCPFCGFDQDATPQPDEAMRRNTILHGKYLIGDVLGQGGFGITYIGFDLSLESKVAIKEYCPVGAATRRQGQNSLLWNNSHLSQAFRQSAYDDFLKEARKMAKMDQIPSIVRVRETFLENETAYIVMDYIEGETLKTRLKRDGVMKFADCIALLRPMMEDLDKVHAQGLIHRDISPDNIMIQPDGKVKLLDLGAAKDLTLQKEGVSQLVTKKGFSPPEQYMDSGKIGPWTDVYALCATIYYACYGRMVTPSLERLGQDTLTFSLAAKEPLPPEAVQALKQGLAVRVEERTQSVGQLLAQLESTSSAKKQVLDKLDDLRKKSKLKLPRRAILGAAAAVMILVFTAVFFLSGEPVTIQTLGITNANLINYGGYQETENYQYTIGADNGLYLCTRAVDGTFYLDQAVKVSDFGSYINLSKDSVYYCYTDYITSSIRRMDYDGQNVEDLVLSDQELVLMQYVQMSNGREYLYYIVRTEKAPNGVYGDLYRYDLKTGKSERLAQGDLFWFNLNKDSLYTMRYDGESGTSVLEKRTLKGENPVVIDDQNLCYNGFIEEDKIFLWSLHQEAILIYDLNGEYIADPQGLYDMNIDLVEGIAYGDGWLYYTNTQDSSIHRMRTNGTGDQLVLEGHTANVINYNNYWLWFIETTQPVGTTYGTMQAYLCWRDSSEPLKVAGQDFSWQYETPMLREFEYELNDAGDGYIITKYIGDAINLSIPRTIAGLPVTEIGAEAFKGSSIQQVEILPNVKKIGDNAFFECEDLIVVKFPDGLIEIGDNAFGKCSRLTGVLLPDSLTKIGKLSFAETNLSSVYIPANLTDIGYGAFAVKSNAGLTAFVVSTDNPVYEAVDGILYQDNRLTLTACPSGWQGKVCIDSNTIQIGTYAFVHCSQVTEIEIPVSVLWINYQAFFGCNSLKSIRVTTVCELAEELGVSNLQIERYEPTQRQKEILLELRNRLRS